VGSLTSTKTFGGERLLSEREEMPPCLKILQEHDAEYGQVFAPLFQTTFSPGALDVKTKMLIAMAVNASTGIGYGCSEIAKILKDMGTSKKEISEALRVASTVKAIQGVVTGSEAYKI
jgi:alkylhydroperoxidase/carboxymuconolactone decarboxylase family protein YurZ